MRYAIVIEKAPSNYATSGPVLQGASPQFLPLVAKQNTSTFLPDRISALDTELWLPSR